MDKYQYATMAQCPKDRDITNYFCLIPHLKIDTVLPMETTNLQIIHRDLFILHKNKPSMTPIYIYLVTMNRKNVETSCVYIHYVQSDSGHSSTYKTS